MNPTTVERTIWIAAPRRRVWQAVSEPDQIAQWLLPPAMGAQMKRDGDGRLLVCLGPMEAPIAQQETAEPPARLTTRGLPDGLIATTYTLKDENDGTRLTVVLSGFEALPTDLGRERLVPSGRAW